MNGWIDVNDQLPEDDKQVLAVKQLKSGRREICLAYCKAHWERYDPIAGHNVECGPYWVCGGNNNIIFWQELPEIPKGGSK